MALATIRQRAERVARLYPFCDAEELEAALTDTLSVALAEFDRTKGVPFDAYLANMLSTSTRRYIQRAAERDAELERLIRLTVEEFERRHVA